MQIANGYEPYDRQLNFHNSDKKFRAFIAGVGSGKSAAGANEILKMALAYPKSQFLILAPNSRIMNFATLAQFWKFCPREIVDSHSQSKTTIKLKGGGTIFYLTADNERHIDRLRGMEIGGFWADETRFHPSYIWDILLTRLRDQYGPLRGIVTTTPSGHDWLYYVFMKTQHPRTKKEFPNKDEYAWFGSSTLLNPFTPESYKQNLLNQLAGKFARQEIYGEVVGFEGQVYDNFKHDVHIIKENPNVELFKEIVCGVDFGFTNAMACLIVGIDSDDRAYVLEEYYHSKKNMDHLAEWLNKKKGAYSNLNIQIEPFDFNNIYCDPSEPMLIAELCELGLPAMRAKNEVMPGIHFTYTMFDVQKDNKPRIFINQHCNHLIEEINQYRYLDVKEDKEAKEQPLKVNDHAMDALRYVLFSHLGVNRGYVFLDDKKGAFF